MRDEPEIIADCVKALNAAKPYVIDGRGNEQEIDMVLQLINAALERASSPPRPAPDPAN